MKRIIYLDNERTTIVAKEVIEAMLPYMNEYYGHPASLHTLGQQAYEAIEQSAETIAETINAKSDEIVFTSCGTEANDFAIRGIAYANRNRGNHIITTKIEHPSIMRITEELAKQGFKIDYLEVDKEGFIDIGQLENLLTDETILVSVMHINHEIGTIEPIKEVGKLLRERKRKIYFHVDAQSSYTKIPIDVQDFNIDLLTLSSHKIHGPKGVGALYIRQGTKIEPILKGYISVQRLRPGTENVPGIVGFAKAAEIAFAGLEKFVSHMRTLRDKLIKGIEDNIPEVLLHGPRGDKRSPSNVNFSFKYIEGESITLHLNMYGICVSTGSACASRKLEPSHVLTAIGVPPEIAHGSIMFSLSRYNTEEEIDYVLDVLPKVIGKLRSISPLTPESLKKSGG